MTIKVIEAPSIFPVGRQQVNVPALDAFLSSEGVGTFQSDAKKAGEELVEVAGRLCYMSFKKPRPGGNVAYIDHILEVGHGSVCEHAVFNFIITGVSRSLTHQLTRHRAGWSYSELSQRFVDSSDVAFVLPPAYIHDPLSRAVWLDSCAASLAHYQALLRGSGNGPGETTLSKKQRREAARSVLPESTETKIFVTANARALRHFVELRGDVGADAEIRRLAHAMLAVLVVESPNLFGDMKIVEQDGIDVIRTPYRKV